MRLEEMMSPSKFQIVNLEAELVGLKRLEKELTKSRLRCNSLNQRVEIVQGKLEQLRDWYEECRLNGYC